MLGVCGGYQLLGHSYTLDDEQIPGVGCSTCSTVREDGPRLIGNVAIEVSLDRDRDGRTATTGPCAGTAHGGCSPASRTTAAERASAQHQQPLGRVLKGHGNDGRSGMEGARSANTIGTYLHGPLLPKNAWFADWLIARALGVQEDELQPLEDTIEDQTHASALRAAGV